MISTEELDFHDVVYTIASDIEESGSLGDMTFSVGKHCVLNNRKPEAGAAGLSGAARINPVKTLEQMWQMLGAAVEQKSGVKRLYCN